jgi:hypothetical protein
LAEEKEVGEPREAYVTEVPLYYDRFIEERDRRIAVELHELRSLVEVNTQRIEELRVDLLGGLAVAKEDRLRGFGEARQQRQRGFEGAREERLRGFEEARQQRQRGFEGAREEQLRGFEEARQERLCGLEEAKEERQRGFEEARQERLRGFEEARADRQLLHERLDRLERKVDVNFRWTIGLLMPIVVGILVIIARSFFGLP